MDPNRMDRVNQITQYVKQMPTLPVVMMKLIELVDDPNTTAPKLARFISNDPPMTSKILRLANSAFFGFPHKIGTINLAIVVLGFQSVKDLALAATVVQSFGSGECEGYFKPARFWLHSIAVAAGCKIMGQEGNFKITGEIFVTGLLHDIGILILCNEAPELYIEVLKKTEQNNAPINEIEFSTLGFNHADLGGWLLESWKLPPHQVAAVYDHCNPWLSFRRPNLGMLVHFSNLLAERVGYRLWEKETVRELHPKVTAYLNLKQKDEGEVDWCYYEDLLQKEMVRAQDFLNVLRDVI